MLLSLSFCELLNSIVSKILNIALLLISTWSWGERDIFETLVAVAYPCGVHYK